MIKDVTVKIDPGSLKEKKINLEIERLFKIWSNIELVEVGRSRKAENIIKIRVDAGRFNNKYVKDHVRCLFSNHKEIKLVIIKDIRIPRIKENLAKKITESRYSVSEYEFAYIKGEKSPCVECKRSEFEKDPDTGDIIVFEYGPHEHKCEVVGWIPMGDKMKIIMKKLEDKDEK